MKLFQFARENGKFIEQFGSDFYMSRILEGDEGVHIGYMFLDPGGKVGYHEAVVPQLFFVVRGEGWVSGANGQKVHVVAGQAAFWEKAEGHAAGTASGITALVIESEELDPERIMATQVR